MFEMTIVLGFSLTLMLIAYEFALIIREKDFGENAKSIF